MKIIRRPDRAEGGITPEEKVKMDAVSAEWKEIAMRTEPINVPKIAEAIRGLYAAAKLKQPRIVVVDSPLVMAAAYGAAAWIWYCRKNGKSAATSAATDAATDAASYEERVFNTVRLLAGKGGIECAKKWFRPYQGGNMWAAWDSYLTAARDVLGLKLPQHDEYKHWENAAREGGFRIMHEEFCIVSNFPKTIKKDDQNRPHCDDGPSHEWRDGCKLYHIHGVRIPNWIMENPEKITPKTIDDEENSEVRRVMIEKFGTARYISEGGSKLVHQDRFGALWRKELTDDEPILMVQVLNSTPEEDGSFTHEEATKTFGKHAKVNHDGMMIELGDAPNGFKYKGYFLRVPPTTKTAKEGVAWTNFCTEEEYDLELES